MKTTRHVMEEIEAHDFHGGPSQYVDQPCQALVLLQTSQDISAQTNPNSLCKPIMGREA